jgi:hypothetical protein
MFSIWSLVRFAHVLAAVLGGRPAFALSGGTTGRGKHPR